MAHALLAICLEPWSLMVMQLALCTKCLPTPKNKLDFSVRLVLAINENLCMAFTIGSLSAKGGF